MIGTIRRGWRRFSVGVLRRTRSRGDEAYLLSSPANATRLREAIDAARNGAGTPVSIEALRAEHGFEKA